MTPDVVADPEPSCYSCRESATPDLPPHQRIWQTQYWRVAHAFNSGLPGWLVVVPLRHILSLAELTPGEADELGPMLATLTRSLTAAVGCVKTYVILLAEAEGFAHVHFHVVPRMPDQPLELRGPKIFGALGVAPEDRVCPEDMDRLALRIRDQMALPPP